VYNYGLVHRVFFAFMYFLARIFTIVELDIHNYKLQTMDELILRFYEEIAEFVDWQL
jgi:hypothetical protein